ncbi:protein of unknown function (plasmid) [Escherichia coli]|nr:protein of unknown function [Escherichia coli]
MNCVIILRFVSGIPPLTSPMQAGCWKDKTYFVPDFAMAISLIEQNVGIGYIPHHLALPLLNRGKLLKSQCANINTPPSYFLPLVPMV